jgi:hypothetical protein
VLGLLGLAAASTVLGEVVRLLAARWVASWRELEAIERGLLDFFLGGAAFYLLAALPVGGFGLPALLGLLLVGAVGVLLAAVRRARARTLSLSQLIAPALRPAPLLTLGIGLALFVFEAVVALPVGTGNTYDSSLLTFYTSRLLDGHQLALSFRPSTAVGILYPQGTTAWLGASELLVGLPGARASLLLTPLFFGLAPLGGFVLGRRLLGTDLAGLSFALVLATTASWTRVLVGGSNDFVFAFPLVLWLAGQAVRWVRAVPTLADAAAFGLVLGYSATLNPVGAEWLLPALLIAAALVVPRFAGSLRRWLGRWATALGVALLPLLPSWWVLGGGLGSPDLVPGAGAPPSGAAYGINSAQFVGAIDPYLFRSQDVWLSPLPALRLELAVLLTLGLALVFLFGRSVLGSGLGPTRAFLVGGLAATIGWLVLAWAGSIGGSLARPAELTSVAELSIWLFTLYALIATLPLWIALRRAVRALARPTPFVPSRFGRRPSEGLSGRTRPRNELAWLFPAAAAILILLPGAVLTPTQLPPVLANLYNDFGNVTAADFDLLSFAGAHLPNGARVLVAPGSAGEFLPVYAPRAVLLFPMVPGWAWLNASYGLVIRELTNATLDPAGMSAVRVLGVQFIVVTQANTVLWPAFSPVPLLGDASTFAVLFHEGDAYLFTLGSVGLPSAGES